MKVTQDSTDRVW